MDDEKTERICGEVVWERASALHVKVQCRLAGKLETLTHKCPIIYMNHLWGCNFTPEGGSCTDGLSGKVKIYCNKPFGVKGACGMYPLPPEKGGR